MRFLHAADLHLDSPLRGLERYAGAPVGRLRNATREALQSLVDLALREQVDFVLLAGDIYDGDWQDFHTGLFFREQLLRLGRQGIRVFMVQGNHDAQGVITRQLRLPEHCHLFPSDAAGSVQIESLGVAIHGRSFPQRAVAEDLVPGYPAAVPGLFNIGLLHTSLNGRPGHDPYAPTDVATLSATGYDYWALGHVHRREVVQASLPRIVYPGNLQGRHARETGPKGCELVRLEGGQLQAEAVALDVVRWAQLEIDLAGLADPAALHQALRQALLPALEAADGRLLALRLHLRGATALQRLEASQPGRLENECRAAATEFGEGDVWIEQVRLQLRSPLDRAREAQRDDAVGELLRLIADLAGDEQALRACLDTQIGLGELLDELPVEVREHGQALLTDPAERRALLADAEATVLARLAAAGAEADPPA